VAEFDPKKPSDARVYDLLTGGKDNFESDRAVLRRLAEICPDLTQFMSANKDFVERAVTYAAARGVAQFVDLGAGFPRPPATHEAARAVLPVARVVYVDDDPQVLRHLTAWYAHNDDGVEVVNADVADHGTVLAAVRYVFDLTRPCCVLLGMMLHFYPADAARALVAGYLDAVAPGSYLIASSACGSAGRAAEFWAEYAAAVRPVYPHSPETFASFFGTAELIPPGVGDVRTWRAGSPAAGPAGEDRAILCGVARTA
jgi:O-methyltransferase involved in polyketide biosynthesis